MADKVLSCRFKRNIAGKETCVCKFSTRHGKVCSSGCMFTLSRDLEDLSRVLFEALMIVRGINRRWDKTLLRLEQAIKGAYNIASYAIDEAKKDEFK